MFRASPWHGFGLGTWPSVYPQFALFDAGAFVNHAHNEWAQWAAEGGLVALGLMLAVLAWCSKPALRSVWGLGLLAVFLHSLVDYPFLRLGLAAWILCLDRSAGGRLARWRASGTVARHSRAQPGARAISGRRVVHAPGSGGIRVRADGLRGHALRESRPETVAKAARLCPGSRPSWAAMAAMDPESAVTHLRRALAEDPRLTSARIALAAELEQQGDLKSSEEMSSRPHGWTASRRLRGRSRTSLPHRPSGILDRRTTQPDWGMAAWLRSSTFVSW